MKTAYRLSCVLLASALVAAGVTTYAQKKSAVAKSPAKAVSSSKDPRLVFKDLRLKNGLRVLLVEDHAAPVISLAVNYNVGSRNERQGRTGFAHLFEHMMFQGSENIGKSEHFILVSNNGGDMNGTTDQDRTLYFETLPANQLELILFLEADRMKGLDITQTNLDNQRNAVQEERRLGVDNQPYGKLREKFGETMVDNFAYHHSVIGSMEDLNAATVEDVKDFFRIYYAPNNAVLALVGDFKTEQTLPKIKKYFESLPSQPTPPPVDVTETEQTAERRFTLDDPLAQLPLILIGYRGAAANTPDGYALRVLANVLGSGQSSRLYQKLIKDKQVALQAGSFAEQLRGAGGLIIQAIVAPGKKTAEVEAAVYEEIAGIQQEGITDQELEKARTAAKRSKAQSRQRTLGLAIDLVEATVAHNDPNLVNTEFDKMMAVTKADVQRVATKYLKATNRTVGIAIPKPKGAEGSPAAAK